MRRRQCKHGVGTCVQHVADGKIHNLIFEKMDVTRKDPQGNMRRQSNVENVRMTVCDMYMLERMERHTC